MAGKGCFVCRLEPIVVIGAIITVVSSLVTALVKIDGLNEKVCDVRASVGRIESKIEALPRPVLVQSDTEKLAKYP